MVMKAGDYQRSGTTINKLFDENAFHLCRDCKRFNDI